MSYREDQEFLAQMKEERRSLRENEIKNEQELRNQRIIERDSARALHEAKIDKFYKYKDDVKNTLYKKAFMEICLGSFNNPSTREKATCENLIEQYIGELGTTKLQKLMRFSENSMLQRLNEKVNSCSKKMTEEANPEDEYSQTINKADVDEFWNDVDKSEDIEDITNTIRLRVSNAEEEFANKNAEDKEDIKSILKDTADRINAAKATNDNDYSEEVEESAMKYAYSDIYDIQHSKAHNVFDRIVRNISEVALKNTEAKKVFTNSSGRLNLDNIVESARCVYTVLEMVSTLRLENTDEKYIEDMLKSIH